MLSGYWSDEKIGKAACGGFRRPAPHKKNREKRLRYGTVWYNNLRDV